MAVVKRVRKQLDKGLTRGPSTSGMTLSQRIDALKRDDNGEGFAAEAVVLGTGKAIQKCLSVASWFSHQKDCDVSVRTRTVGTVDDIIVDGDELDDESRVRRVSAMEVSVRLR
jgi:ribonuclease P/MRP protein subunit POP7